MIIEKVVFVSSIIILMILLGYKAVEKHNNKNIIVIGLLAICLGIYLPFVIYNISIPYIFQIGIFIVGILFPLIYTVIQYNDIKLARKILYRNMKKAYKYKNYERTMELLKKLIYIDGYTSEYALLLGICYKENNELINAEECYEKAIEIDKYNPQAHYELGVIYEKFSQKKEAVDFYVRAIKIKPDYYEAYEALAINLTRQGKFNLAIDIYKRATLIFPNSFEIFYNLAMLESEIGERYDAIEHFEKVLVIKPDLFTARYTLGVLYYEKKEYQKAIDEFSKILNNSIYGTRAYYKLAIVYMEMKDYERAMSSLEYAMELDSHYVKEADKEYIFNPIRDRINDYKIQKEKAKIKDYSKRSFIDRTFKLLKLDDKEEKTIQNEVEKKNEKNVDESINNEEENNDIKMQNNA